MPAPPNILRIVSVLTPQLFEEAYRIQIGTSASSLRGSLPSLQIWKMVAYGPMALKLLVMRFLLLESTYLETSFAPCVKDAVAAVMICKKLYRYSALLSYLAARACISSTLPAARPPP